MPNQRKRKAQIGKPRLSLVFSSPQRVLVTKLLSEMHELLSIWGMTPLQYNALRVLYVEDKEDIGLPSKEVGVRLTTRVPDVTRLLDRMVEKGWITRERDLVNKRLVRSRLTDIGIKLVESAHAPMLELETKQLSHLSVDEKNKLSALLKKALNNKIDDS